MARNAAIARPQTIRHSQKKRAGLAAQAAGQTPTTPLSPPVTSVHWKASDQAICAKASVSIAE